MAKNKDTPDQLTAHELLEARIDAMMDPDAITTTDSGTVSSAPTLPGAKPKTASKTPAPSQTVAVPIVASKKPITGASPEIILVGSSNLDTPKSDAAIDDIVAQEADEVLAAEDAGLAAAQEALPAQPQKRGHPVFWFLILVMATVAIVAAVILTNPNLQLPFEA